MSLQSLGKNLSFSLKTCPDIGTADELENIIWIPNFVAVTALEYFQDPAVQEKVEEVGRIIYSNDSVTVNLSAVIAAGILALLGWSHLLSDVESLYDNLHI